MKNRLALALACLGLLFTNPATAYIGGDNRIAAALGIRYDAPVEGTRVGQKVNATVLNASKLAPHGVNARNNDKVVLTLTGKNTFTLVHAASGRILKFTFDANGNLTPAR